MPLAGVVIDEQFADRLGHAVRSLGRALGQVAHRGRHRGSAETGNTTGEHHAWPAFNRACRFENISPSIEVDTDGVIVPLLAFAADHRGQVKDGDIRRPADRRVDQVALANVADDLLHSRIVPRHREADIDQHHFVDGFLIAGRAGECSSLKECRGKLGTEKSAAAGDDDFHSGK